jgi:translation elongation factor EF-4
MMTGYLSQVFHQRLLDEFNMPVLLTTPNVPYTFVDSHTGAQQVVVNLGEWHSASTDSSGSSKRMVSETLFLRNLNSFLHILWSFRMHCSKLQYCSMSCSCTVKVANQIIRLHIRE